MRVPLRKATAAVGAAILVVLGLPVLGNSAAAEDEGISVAGRLPRIGQDAIKALGSDIVPRNFFKPIGTSAGGGGGGYAGTIIAFPEIRRMWQMYEPSKDGASQGTAVAIRDLDSLKLVGTLRTPLKFNRDESEWRHTVDPGRRIFFLTRDQRSIAEIDLRTLAIREIPLTTSNGPAPIVVGGLTYDAASGSILALFGEVRSSDVNMITFLGKVNVADGKVDLRLMRACNGPLTGTQLGRYGDQILLPPGSPYLYVPCARAGYAAEVVRLARATMLDSHSTEEVAVGPVQLVANFADPAASRLYMLTTGGEIWVFDAPSMSFVGVVGAHVDDRSPSTMVGFGLDTDNGRVFFQSPSLGFGVVDARFFPVPQARTYNDGRAKGFERIYSDARTNRVYVLPGSPTQHDYVIYKVDPAAAPPAVDDPDLFTVDLPEKEGLTESRFNANGSGYGARILLANGVGPLLPAPAFGVVAPTAMVLAKHIYSTCSFTDRELVAGRVARAEMDTGSTSAEAIAVDTDNDTKIDLDQPSRCDVQGKDNAGNAVFAGIFTTAPKEIREATDQNTEDENNDGQPDEASRWDKRPALCTTSSGDSTVVDEGDGGEHPMGTQKVSCPEPGKTLTASATSGLAGGVTVEAARSDVTIERDPAGGMRSTVVSVARAIDLAGVVRIAEIGAKAVSTADGRPNAKGRNGSSYEYWIRGVKIGNTVLCEKECDPRQVEQAMNAALAGRGQFRVASGLDQRLEKGTPRGAATAIQKSARRQASDISLVGDSTLEVPAAELIIYNDNTEWGRARQLYQFAGVTTSVTYNVMKVPDLVPLPDLPPLPDLDVPEPAPGPVVAVPSAQPQSEPLPAVQPPSRKSPSPIVQVARGLALMVSNPRQALLLATAWAFLLLPLFLAHRRALLRESTG